MRTRIDETANFARSRETRYGGADRSVMLVTEQWDGDPAMKTYLYQMKRSVSIGDNDGERYVVSASQVTRLDQNKLAWNLSNKEGGDQLNSQPRPDNYIPGGWLASLVGQLSDKPMILTTDVFVSDQGLGIPSAIRLIVTPGGPTQYLDKNQKPLRCVSIENNGQGEISRWYFNSDGSLESVDYPENLRLTRTDASGIKFDFVRDPRMLP